MQSIGHSWINMALGNEPVHFAQLLTARNLQGLFEVQPYLLPFPILDLCWKVLLCCEDNLASWRWWVLLWHQLEITKGYVQFKDTDLILGSSFQKMSVGLATS